MNTDQKIIKNKVGLLNVAQMRGSVSQACKMDGLLAGQLLLVQGDVRQRWRTGAAGNQPAQALLTRLAGSCSIAVRCFYRIGWM